MNNIADTLISFINMPIDDGAQIFEKFSALPNAVFEKGEKPHERFLYIPGTREDRVLLTAHVDTVWDKVYTGKEAAAMPIVNDGVIESGNDIGIGGDDRAGCAMLWLLRNSGHSLLLLDGEEKEHKGAKFLAKKHKKLLKEINEHTYILQLDFPGNNFCKYHGIKNTKGFCDFIESNGFVLETKIRSSADIYYLCKKACGANISVGYYKMHRKEEKVVIAEWQEMYKRIEDMLSKHQDVWQITLANRILTAVKDVIKGFLKIIGLYKPLKKLIKGE